jgi:hypothetical protein
VTPLIRRLAALEPQEKEAPLIGCWVNQGWSSSARFTGHPEWPDTGTGEAGESGLVMVVVARERGSSAQVCEFLVDTWCLGVKNALGPKSVERRKLPSFCADAFRGYPGEPVEVPLVLAQRIVFGAVGYARGLGFEPHADFTKAAGHLGEWDGECDLEFGRDGMPMYIEGPHDDTGIPTAFGFRSANCLFAIEEYLSTRETAEVLDRRSSRSGSQLTMP